MTDEQRMQTEQRMQAMLDKYGYVVLGESDPNKHHKVGDVVSGIHTGTSREPRPDLKVVVVGFATVEEWKRRAIEVFGPDAWGPNEDEAALQCQVLKVVAE